MARNFCGRPVSTFSIMREESPPILEARDLAKRYGAVTAVRDIGFSIRAGPDPWRARPQRRGQEHDRKDGHRDCSNPRAAPSCFTASASPEAKSAASNAVWAMFPNSPICTVSSPAGNIWTWWPRCAVWSAAASREKAAAMLEGFTLYPHRDTPIASYSKGMRQRIVLIAALMHDPELLVLDEPFSGLDVTSALVVRRVVAMLAAQGKAIFFSSPVLEQVEKLCSHLVVLKKGSVVASGTIGRGAATGSPGWAWKPDSCKSRSKWMPNGWRKIFSLPFWRSEPAVRPAGASLPGAPGAQRAGPSRYGSGTGRGRAARLALGARRGDLLHPAG